MVANKVDGIDAAAPSELVDSELQAKKPARFWVYLKQNGIPDFYWFVLAANSDWAQKNPAAAKAFTAVTMKAVKWSFQHQKEAVGIFVKTYKKDVSPELASKAWAQIVKYDSTRFKPSKPAGYMDPAIWKSYAQFLTTKKFFTDTVNVDDVLTGNQYVSK
jgi:ABC-type nitrate/sulfonate/bicarbonate transport system substrate-binding protein